MKTKSRNFTTLQVLCTVLVLCFSSLTKAQSENESTEDKDIHSIENLLEKDIKFTPTPAPHKSSTVKNPKKVDYKESQIVGDYQDLGVVQKIYMPKAERFQVTLGATLLPTDVYFRTYGLNSKLSYHFNEYWGVEAAGYLMTSSARSEVNDLEQRQQVVVKNQISVKSFYGLNLYYSSIYGKTSVLNQKIVPFEIYQIVGLGKVVNQDNEESTSFQVGIGELFSISRSSAVRIDLTWAFYNTKNILGESQSANSVFVSFNYSFFLSEPKYR